MYRAPLSAWSLTSLDKMSTVVVKVGTSSILRGDTGHMALSTLAALAETLVELTEQGHRVVLVSSGAVGVGCQRLGVTERPTKIEALQAMAAVGQPHLMHQYEVLFSALGQPIAQVLLSADALDSQSGYRNAKATFEELLSRKVIPIVNENDSVAVSELRFGDNDSLSALVAILVSADRLFLATDVDGLYTANPSTDPTATRIGVVQDAAAAIRRVEAAGSGGSGTQWGTGGIVTKLRAAQVRSRGPCRHACMQASKARALTGRDQAPRRAARGSGGDRDVDCARAAPRGRGQAAGRRARERRWHDGPARAARRPLAQEVAAGAAGARAASCVRAPRGRRRRRRRPTLAPFLAGAR